MNWRKLGLALVVTDAVLLNILVGYVLYQPFRAPTPVPSSLDTAIVEGQNACGLECQKYIDEKLAILTRSTPSPKPTPTPTPQVVYQTVVAPKTKTRSVSYLTVAGSGSSSTNDWSTIGGTDFYFNTADYPGLVEVYFESNMRLFNGNGMAYVRLYDATHGIGVQGSEVQTASQTSVLVTSGKLAFWAGKNVIRVQAKSLTADTAVFESGRLRIVTEN